MLRKRKIFTEIYHFFLWKLFPEVSIMSKLEAEKFLKKENHRENKDGKQKYEMRGKYDVSDDCAGYGWHVTE